jgi:hypothetical protein
MEALFTCYIREHQNQLLINSQTLLFLIRVEERQQVGTVFRHTLKRLSITVFTVIMRASFPWRLRGLAAYSLNSRTLRPILGPLHALRWRSETTHPPPRQGEGAMFTRMSELFFMVLHW